MSVANLLVTGSPQYRSAINSPLSPPSLKSVSEESPSSIEEQKAPDLEKNSFAIQAQDLFAKLERVGTLEDRMKDHEERIRGKMIDELQEKLEE